MTNTIDGILVIELTPFCYFVCVFTMSQGAAHVGPIALVSFSKC